MVFGNIETEKERDLGWKKKKVWNIKILKEKEVDRR